MFSIVLIEDEPPTLYMVKQIIESLELGFEVVGFAFNGEDGEALVRQLQPDVVITDIKMPVKDGITMIQDLVKAGVEAEWMILSGYSEFEYAVQALRVGVRDYILKPLDPQSIQILFEKLVIDLNRKKAKQEYNYLGSLLHLQTDPQQPALKLDFPQYAIVLLQAGNLTPSIHDALNSGKTYFTSAVLEQISSAFSQKGRCWCLNGFSMNQRIVLLAANQIDSVDVSSMANQLLRELPDSTIHLNMLVGKPFAELGSLFEEAHERITQLSQYLVIGESRVFHNEFTGLNTFPKNELEQACSHLMEEDSFDAFSRQFLLKIAQWKQNHIPQRVMEQWLNRIMEALQHKYAKELYQSWDLGEILAESRDLDELAHAYLNWVKVIFSDEGQVLSTSSNSIEIVEKIEDFLKIKYREPITYEVLQDYFGYHKDYIAQLFRQVKGLSPNKYLTLLRIEKAKELMTTQSKWSLKETAEYVGYEDSLYFSRVFKNVTGVNPSTFREQVRAADRGGERPS